MTTEQRHFARHLRQAGTKAEHLLWQAVRARRLSGLKFRRQVPIGIYTVDFLCVEKHIIVELDGAQHRHERQYDEARTSELETMGWNVVRLPNDIVLNDIDEALRLIVSALTPSPLPNGRGVTATSDTLP